MDKPTIERVFELQEVILNQANSPCLAHELTRHQPAINLDDVRQTGKQYIAKSDTLSRCQACHMETSICGGLSRKAWRLGWQ
jgi:hypothetical protein